MRAIKTVTNSLRKHDGLRVHRSSISTNSFPTKYALHIDPPRFVESDTPSLHDDVHIPLGVLIQSSSRIARFDVLCKIEVGAVEACFGIAGKVGGNARVADSSVGVADGIMDVVEPVWNVAGCCKVGYGWCDRFPEGAGRVEDWERVVRACTFRWRVRRYSVLPVATMRKKKVKE